MDESNLALLIIRMSLGLLMAAHGYKKMSGPGGISGTVGWFDSIGMRPAKVHAVMAAGGEVVAGLCLAAGFLTSFAALGFVGLMAVAYYTTHAGKGFMVLHGGWEFVFILAVMAVTVAMLGPLEWSLDAAIGWDDELDGYVGLIISAGGGVAAAAALLLTFYRPPVPND